MDIAQLSAEQDDDKIPYEHDAQVCQYAVEFMLTISKQDSAYNIFNFDAPDAETFVKEAIAATKQVSANKKDNNSAN